MAIPVGSNFDLKAQLPIDGRMLFDTIADMRVYDNKFLPDMYICQVKETGKIYSYNVSNTFDLITGRWRELSGTQRFEYKQTTASTTWTVTHSLNNWHPIVTCFDDSGDEIFGDIQYFSQNVVVITFCVPIKGMCYVQ